MALVVILTTLGAYLTGSIPFGYLVGRARGVNVLTSGSGNIGATNVGRVCGKRWGVLVFLLDFAKGAVPVWLASLWDAKVNSAWLPQTLPVLAGISAFLGHLFPIWLGFRGGKGVATGAGVIAVLVPFLTLLVLVVWGILVYFTRFISLASMLSASLLFVLRITLYPAPWSRDHLIVTLFCLLGAILVLIRHHANIRRLFAGTEPHV